MTGHPDELHVMAPLGKTLGVAEDWGNEMHVGLQLRLLQSLEGCP